MFTDICIAAAYILITGENMYSTLTCVFSWQSLHIHHSYLGKSLNI